MLKGNVIIFTERVACSSCKNVVEQFKQKYPHIDVKIMHNHGNQVLPPKMQ